MEKKATKHGEDNLRDAVSIRCPYVSVLKKSIEN